MPPAELEAVLLSHESVADAAVIGVPDQRHGELPLAWVVTKPHANITEKQLEQFVAGLYRGCIAVNHGRRQTFGAEGDRGQVTGVGEGVRLLSTRQAVWWIRQSRNTLTNQTTFIKYAINKNKHISSRLWKAGSD